MVLLRMSPAVCFQRNSNFTNVFFARGFPLTSNPSPQKFGVSLTRLDSLIVRIYGERGASLGQWQFKVNAIGLASLTTRSVISTCLLTEFKIINHQTCLQKALGEVLAGDPVRFQESERVGARTR